MIRSENKKRLSSASDAGTISQPTILARTQQIIFAVGQWVLVTVYRSLNNSFTGTLSLVLLLRRHSSRRINLEVRSKPQLELA